MKHTERELLLARSAIELYGKLKGKDSLDIDDINFILENGHPFLNIILNELDVGLGEFRKAIQVNDKIKINDLISSNRLAYYIGIGLVKSGGRK